jgi:phosphoribosylformylglycinamidine cyclo-ligase
MYADGEYDLAGFAVGVVARSRIVDGKRVGVGDTLLGLPSSGLHSNGYSLARKVLLEVMGLGLQERPKELAGRTVADVLLEPTRLYAKAVQAVLSAGVDVRAMSHITGGGLPGNLPRVLPEGCGAHLDQPWERAPVFDLIAKGGPVGEKEMLRTFNMGIGFVFVVPSDEVAKAVAALKDAGERPQVLGTIEAVPEGTEFEERVRISARFP